MNEKILEETRQELSEKEARILELVKSLEDT